MTQEVDEVPAFLNRLIEVPVDGEEGYDAAAQEVENSELSGIFRHYGQQRAKFVKELRTEGERLGGVPAERGTVSGAVNSTIHGETRGIIEKQAKQIREAHSHMLRLKEDTASGVSFAKNE